VKEVERIPRSPWIIPGTYFDLIVLHPSSVLLGHTTLRF
jgi:hypothetical protein